MTWYARATVGHRLLLAALLCALIFSGRARAEFTVEVDSRGVLEGAVVVARALGGQQAERPMPEKLAMTQINRQFEPFILAVPLNVPVEFPNRDSTAHHVYSFSPAGSFELPLYKGETPAPITFTQTGVVPLGCNIHDWMIGYIYVVDSPFYTQLANSAARFDDLPGGDYEISIWHPALEGPAAPTWRISVDGSSDRQTLTLDYPFVAVTRPEPPSERFDEQRDY